MIITSPFEPLPVAEVALQRKFFEYFAEHRDKIAMIDGITGKEYTYHDIIHTSKRVASGLVKLGVQKGDVFAVYCLNSPELVIMMFAVFCTGATLTSVNYRHTSYELKERLLDSAAKFMYTSNDRKTAAEEATKDMNFFREIIVFSHDDRLTSYEQLSQDDYSEWRTLEAMKFNPKDDVLILLYSSGTTGKSKGVPLTHYNALCNSFQLRHPQISGPPRPISTIVAAPLYHGFAFSIFVCFHMANGSKLIINPTLDVEEFLKAVDTYSVTHLYLPASVATLLAKAHLTSKCNLSSLKHACSGAAPIRKEALDAFCDNFRICEMNQVYGMTEAGTITFNIYNEKEMDESVGVFLPGFEGQVTDVNTGDSLGPHQQGELYLRGPQLMKGYLNRPDATREVFDSNGWFYTGDVAYYDEDNHIYIIDRIKDIFKVDGFQVSPSELEGVLFGHPAVLDVGVVGIPDELHDSKPKAFVVKNAGIEVTDKQLCDHVASCLAQYKWLTGGVEFVKEIPKSSSGKILRRQLQEMAIQSMKKD